MVVKPPPSLTAKLSLSIERRTSQRLSQYEYVFQSDRTVAVWVRCLGGEGELEEKRGRPFF